MSAFLVHKTHIDLLVDVARRGPRDIENPKQWESSDYAPDALGRALWGQNLRSVRECYPDSVGDGSTDKTVANYEFECPAYRLTLAEANKALHCLLYQSCETMDYEDTLAGAWTYKMLFLLEHCIPGYEAAPWIWDAIGVEKRVNAGDIEL